MLILNPLEYVFNGIFENITSVTINDFKRLSIFKILRALFIEQISLYTLIYIEIMFGLSLEKLTV